MSNRFSKPAKPRKAELIAAIGERFRAHSLASDLFDECAARLLGINRTDLRVLDVLGSEGPLSASRLAEVNHLSRPAMTTVIDRLERAGYARRVTSPGDRRAVLVEATDLAQTKGMEIYGPFIERSHAAYSRYSVEQLSLVLDFLTDALALSDEVLDGMRGRVGAASAEEASAGQAPGERLPRR